MSAALTQDEALVTYCVFGHPVASFAPPRRFAFVGFCRVGSSGVKVKWNGLEYTWEEQDEMNPAFAKLFRAPGVRCCQMPPYFLGTRPHEI